MNLEMMDVFVDKIFINTNCNRTFFIDLRLISFDIIIKNIEITLDRIPEEGFEFIQVEFPYSWNPSTCENFYALEFSAEVKVHFIQNIRKWVKAQKPLLDFLRTGFKEVEETEETCSKI